MNRHVLLSPAIDMVKYVGNLLLEHKQMSRSLVVFPGKRPGHFIVSYLAEKLKAPYIPPRIHAMDGFIDQICNELDLTGKMTSAIDCLPLIYKLNNKSRIVAQKRAELTLDEFLPWGFKLFSDFEELYIEEISDETLKTVETLIKGTLPAGIRDKLNHLSDTYKAFYKYLEKEGLTTRAHQYRSAAAGIGKARLSGYDRIYICGFFALTRSEKRIFRHLAHDNRVQFILQDGPGIEKTQEMLGIDAERIGDEPADPEIDFHKAMDSHAEIFGLNQLIQTEKNLGSRDVIVLPLPDSLFPLIHSTLGFVQEYNISMGYPVHRTPLFTLIEALARLQVSRQGDEYPAADYLRLVLHPYVKNIFLDKASYPTRIIFHLIEEEFAESNRRFLTLADLENDERLLDECVKRLRGFQDGNLDRKSIRKHIKKIHDVMVRPLTDIQDIGDCAEKLIEVIFFISRESPANQHPYTTSFIKAMIDGLQELLSSGLAQEKLTHPERYFRLIHNYLMGISHPFSGTPVKGLQVLGFLETRNIKFDRVFLLDVNEGVLPHTTKEDTTLPYAVRKAIGLPIPEDRERIYSYYFTNLVRASRQADIFYVEAADKEKSRFVERLIWDIQKKTKKLEYPSSEIFFSVQFVHSDPKPVKKTGSFQELLKTGLVFSPSALNKYLACPLSYYYEKILKVETKKAVAEDPDPMSVGGLVHDILARFFVPKIGKTMAITDRDLVTMDKIIDQVFSKTYPDADRGSVYMIKSQVRRRLKAFLLHHRDDQFRGTTVRQCENITDRKWTFEKESDLIYIKFPVDKKLTVDLCGKIDRVDERGGQYYIMDYKSGKSDEVPNHGKFDLKKRDEWPDTLVSVQLPTYILLYHYHHQDIPVECMNAGLMIMGKKKFEEKWLFGEDLTPEERGGLFETYKTAVQTLINEILDPDLDFKPTADEENCAGCDYAVFCGRQWVPVKKW